MEDLLLRLHDVNKRVEESTKRVKYLKKQRNACTFANGGLIM